MSMQRATWSCRLPGPAEYVGNGYEVLNREGVVLQVVPRELTEEERERWSSREERGSCGGGRGGTAAALGRVADDTLQHPADIEAARDRALKDLRIRLSILRGNKRSLKPDRWKAIQAQAADIERAGRSVDLALVTTIEQLQGNCRGHRAH